MANFDRRPCAAASLALDYRIAGRLNPVVFRALQLFLLLPLWGAGVLFYQTLFDLALKRDVDLPLALFAATLFGAQRSSQSTPPTPGRWT